MFWFNPKNGLETQLPDPLVLIPGVGCDAMMWEGMPPGLVMTSSATTIDLMASDILARAPDQFALAGHSMGGYIVLAMVAQAPERVRRLALLSTSAAADTSAQRANRLKTIRAAETDFERVADDFARAVLNERHRQNASMVARIADMILRVGKSAFLRHQAAVRDRPDRQYLLENIHVPTLIVTGVNDGIVPPSRAHTMAEKIERGWLVEIAACGHMPQIEAPAATRDALLDWLV